jgi:hypothetical protein
VSVAKQVNEILPDRGRSELLADGEVELHSQNQNPVDVYPQCDYLPFWHKNHPIFVRE